MALKVKAVERNIKFTIPEAVVTEDQTSTKTRRSLCFANE